MSEQFKQQMIFLWRLRQWAGVASPQELCLPADRKQDRARQKCRRDGLVTFEGGYWRLTDKGNVFISQRLREGAVA